VWDAVLVGEGAGALLRARIHHVDSIAAALTVQCQRVEQADQAGAEHPHPMADYRCSLSSFDVSQPPDTIEFALRWTTIAGKFAATWPNRTGGYEKGGSSLRLA